MKTSILLLAALSFATTAFAHPIDDKMNQGMDNKPASMKSMSAMTSMFKGVEVNKGTATLTQKDGKHMLKLSNDFKIPNTPAPHWQIVDGEGNVYLLKQLKIAGDKKNLSITLPSYIKSVKSVQIWCSFAEVVLGEASFNGVQELH